MRTISGPGIAGAVMIAVSMLVGCASAQPDLGMAVEDFEQACFRSDRARGKLVFAERNREVYYCDLWDTHYIFEDGFLVSIEQNLPSGAD